MTTLGIAGASIAGLSSDELLGKVCRDLYFGDGDQNPSITVRLDRLERLAKNVRQLTVAVVLAFVTGVVDIAMRAHR